MFLTEIENYTYFKSLGLGDVFVVFWVKSYDFRPQKIHGTYFDKFISSKELSYHFRIFCVYSHCEILTEDKDSHNIKVN